MKEEQAKAVATDRARRMDMLETQQAHKIAIEKAKTTSILLQLQQKKLDAFQKARDKKMAMLFQVYSRHQKITESSTATETEKGDSSMTLSLLEKQMQDVESEFDKKWSNVNNESHEN